VVSLVPSITEYLADLGLGHRLVGITKFCIHPGHVYRNTTRVGGTKNFDVEKILALKPGLVIANKEENDRLRTEAIMQHVPVWVSNVSTIEDALDMMEQLGHLLACEVEATRLCRELRTGIDALYSIPEAPVRPTAAYLIWRKPYMTAGTDTFISHMLEVIGVQNAVAKWGQRGTRYPEITAEELVELRPQWVLLSSEPYPFAERHITEIEQLGIKRVTVVDGEAFSWYGSRLAKCMPELIRLKKMLST
jgi:ABC-type Fe3+-hydroxamate transport system substrate-binding protein